MVDSAVFEQVIGEFVDMLLFVLAGEHGDDEVEVADGVAGAAKGTGGSGFLDVGRFEDVFAKLFGGGFDGVDAEAAGGAFENFAGFDDVFFGARAKTGKVAKFFFAGEFSTSATVAAPKAFQRKATFFGPKDWRVRTSRRVGGYFVRSLARRE